jgi:hypothetical protein
MTTAENDLCPPGTPATAATRPNRCWDQNALLPEVASGSRGSAQRNLSGKSECVRLSGRNSSTMVAVSVAGNAMIALWSTTTMPISARRAER